jgi:hypothetical protein
VVLKLFFVRVILLFVLQTTRSEVTQDATNLVRQFLRWFDISSGLARLHILSGMASWGAGRHEEALDAWRAGALPQKDHHNSNTQSSSSSSSNSQLQKYDRAVACLLLGRHSSTNSDSSSVPLHNNGQQSNHNLLRRNVSTPGSERLRWLRRARRGFLEVFDVTSDSEEARSMTELVAVEREIDNTKHLGGGGVLRESAFESDHHPQSVHEEHHHNNPDYSSSRPGTSMTNVSERMSIHSRQNGGGNRHGRSRQGMASAASSAGSILGISMEEEEENDTTIIPSLPAMDSVWSKEREETEKIENPEAVVSGHRLRKHWPPLPGGEGEGMQDENKKKKEETTTSLSEAWKRRTTKVRFSVDNTSNAIAATSNSEKNYQKQQQQDYQAYIRPQTTSRGSGRAVVTPQSHTNGNKVDHHYDASIHMKSSSGNASSNNSSSSSSSSSRDISMLAPDGSRVQLMAAVPSSSSSATSGMPRSPLRRPPLASPKKAAMNNNAHLRQGSAGVRRGSPTKKTSSNHTLVSHSSNSASLVKETTMTATKDDVVRQKSKVLDELLAKEVERTNSSKLNNSHINSSGNNGGESGGDSTRPSSDESVRFIQGLHAGADKDRRLLETRLKTEKRRQLSKTMLHRKRSFQQQESSVVAGTTDHQHGSDDGSGGHNGSRSGYNNGESNGEGAPPPLSRSMSKSDSMDVRHVRSETHSEVEALKERLLKERTRQREEMRRRLAARGRQNERRKNVSQDLVNKAANHAYGFYQQQEEAAQASIPVQEEKERVAAEHRIEDRSYLVHEARLHDDDVHHQHEQREQWMAAGGSAGSTGSMESSPGRHQHSHQKFQHQKFQQQQQQPPVTPGSAPRTPGTPGSMYSDRSSLESRGAMMMMGGSSRGSNQSMYLDDHPGPRLNDMNGHMMNDTINMMNGHDDHRHHYDEIEVRRRQNVSTADSQLSQMSQQSYGGGGGGGGYNHHRDGGGSGGSNGHNQRHYNVYTPMSNVSNADTDFDTWREMNFPSYTPSGTAGTMGSMGGGSSQGGLVGTSERGSLDSRNGKGSSTNAHGGVDLTLTHNGGLDPAFWTLQDASSASSSVGGAGESRDRMRRELGSSGSGGSGGSGGTSAVQWIYPLMGTLALPTGRIYRGNLLVAGDVLKIDINHDESDAYTFLAESDNAPGHYALTVKGDEMVPLLTETQMELVRDQRAGRASGMSKDVNVDSMRRLISELADMLDLISNGVGSTQRKLVLRAKDSESVQTNVGGGNGSGESSGNENPLSDMTGILHGLVNGGKSLALKAMLDAGASPAARLVPSGSTLLIEAAKNNDIDCLHVLVASGRADINAVDYEGNTALHYAQSDHSPDAGLTASWLKAHGALSTLSNMYGLKPGQGRQLDRGGYYQNNF